MPKQVFSIIYFHEKNIFIKMLDMVLPIVLPLIISNAKVMKNTNKVSVTASRTTDKQLVKMSGVCYGYIKGDTFGPDEVPVEQYQDSGYSLDVLIDCDGDREFFVTGWYDHDFKEWRMHSETNTITDGMRWSFLPLAIYDTNPELRKTIKL